MSDTSLPNQPSVSPADSYVSSYTPPQGGVHTAPVSSAAPAVSAQAAALSAGKPVADPLAELEKALKEYEAKQQQSAAKTQDVVQKTQTAVQQSSQEDPLEELERVLDEYEAKYKQKQPTQPAVSAPDTTPRLMPEPKQAAASQPHLSQDTVSAAPAQKQAADPEPIEEQNIFELLGVTDAEESEKEAFLDELQQALWEDFLDKDVVLLVSPEQMAEIRKLREQSELSDTARQEQLIQKVEQLVPDVEEIMLEKALELKEDMVRERIAGMKEYYASRPDDMTKIQQAEGHILAGRWKSGAQLLNTLTA